VKPADLWRQGEELAAAYLEASGYAVLARNWRTRAGELDIIAREADWMVFVEVRTRTKGAGQSPHFGSPEESIGAQKQARLVRMVEAYLHDSAWAGPVRIDVIALELAPDGSVQRLAHFRDAVGGGT